MKILFCSQNELKQELGAAKVLIELADAMGAIGWDCTLVDPTALEQHDRGQNLEATWTTLTGEAFRDRYSLSLRRYLQQHADAYDVVDYDHVYLPYPRSEFSPKPLFVARSVLLAHYLETIPLPQFKTWRNWLRSLLKGKFERAEIRRILVNADSTIRAAELVNVSNHHDKAELVKRGHDPHKIIVLSYGISTKRQPLFAPISSSVPSEPIVGFVGTFDNRKGATDLPDILAAIQAHLPQARFRLLGTGKGKDEIQTYFSASVIPQLEVIPRYNANEIAILLSACSVGIFPSYFEGFPFGVLEMLAASMPVIAYDAPGSTMMLPPQYVVPPGDTNLMGQKVVSLLSHQAELAAARCWAKERSQQFQWQDIARQTAQIYSDRCQHRKFNVHL